MRSTRDSRSDWKGMESDITSSTLPADLCRPDSASPFNGKSRPRPRLDYHAIDHRGFLATSTQAGSKLSDPRYRRDRSCLKIVLFSIVRGHRSKQPLSVKLNYTTS